MHVHLSYQVRSSWYWRPGPCAWVKFEQRVMPAVPIRPVWIPATERVHDTHPCFATIVLTPNWNKVMTLPGWLLYMSMCLMPSPSSDWWAVIETSNFQNRDVRTIGSRRIIRLAVSVTNLAAPIQDHSVQSLHAYASSMLNMCHVTLHQHKRCIRMPGYCIKAQQQNPRLSISCMVGTAHLHQR
jgi:hypothetical protein